MSRPRRSSAMLKRTELEPISTAAKTGMARSGVPGQRLYQGRGLRRLLRRRRTLSGKQRYHCTAGCCVSGCEQCAHFQQERTVQSLAEMLLRGLEELLPVMPSAQGVLDLLEILEKPLLLRRFLVQLSQIADHLQFDAYLVQGAGTLRAVSAIFRRNLGKLLDGPIERRAGRLQGRQAYFFRDTIQLRKELSVFGFGDQRDQSIRLLPPFCLEEIRQDLAISSSC